MYRNIALYSPAPGSGKSVVSDTLVREFGYAVVKFAAPLKTMVRGLLAGMGMDAGTVERCVEGDLKETVLPGLDRVTPRHLMQTLGTEWGREAVDQNLWVKLATEKTKSLNSRGVSVVIDDLRFPNEYESVSSFTRVMIQREGITANTAHPSEGLLNGRFFDAHLMNNDSLETLRDRVRYMVKDFNE